MKKLIYILLFILVLVSSSWAAETMTVYSKIDQDTGGSRLRTLAVLCTTDTDGTFSAQLSTSMYDHIKGWIITEVRVINTSAQTSPTADSDLYLRLNAGESFDLLHAAGVNMIDANATNSFPPLDSGDVPSVVYVVDKFHVEVVNNSVDSAVFTVTFILFPSK